MRAKAVAMWLWGVVKAFWWVILLVLGAIFLLGFIKRDKRAQIELDDVIEEKPTSFVKIATEKVRDAMTDVKVEQAIIREKASSRREQLAEIRKEPDGKTRRKKLAEVLSASI